MSLNVIRVECLQIPPDHREHLSGPDQRPAAGQCLRRVADAAPQRRLRRQRRRHRVRVVHPSGRGRPAAFAAAGSGQRTAERLAAVHQHSESGRARGHHDRGREHPDPVRQLVRDPLSLCRPADGRRPGPHRRHQRRRPALRWRLECLRRPARRDGARTAGAARGGLDQAGRARAESVRGARAGLPRRGDQHLLEHARTSSASATRAISPSIRTPGT